MQNYKYLIPHELGKKLSCDTETHILLCNTFEGWIAPMPRGGPRFPTRDAAAHPCATAQWHRGQLCQPAHPLPSTRPSLTPSTTSALQRGDLPTLPLTQAMVSLCQAQCSSAVLKLKAKTSDTCLTCMAKVSLASYRCQHKWLNAPQPEQLYINKACTNHNKKLCLLIAWLPTKKTKTKTKPQTNKATYHKNLFRRIGRGGEEGISQKCSNLKDRQIFDRKVAALTVIFQWN